MRFVHKPQKLLCILLALFIIFAVNSPLLLKKTGAVFFPDGNDVEIDSSDEPDISYIWPDDPDTQPEPPSSNTWTGFPDDDEDDYPYDNDDYPSYTPTSYTPSSQEDTTNRVTEPSSGSTYTPPTSPTQRATSSPTTAGGQTTAAPVPETTTVPIVPSIIEHYAAAEEYLTDTQLDDKTIESAEKDQNAVHIGGGNVIINNAKINRKNDDSTVGENSSHYGVGAAVLATNGIGYISKSAITTEAKSGTGAFAYGGAKIYLADSSVNTSLESSHGLETAETGKVYAWNMDVKTLGNASSPLYSGPGGGTAVIDGGSYISYGLQSPAVSCAGSVALANGDFTADQSAAAQISGANTLTVCDSNLTGNMKLQAEHAMQWTVLLYNPTEEKPEGVSNFFMKNGSLVSKNGGMFFVTNAKSKIYLENVTLKPFKNAEFLLRCTGNSDEELWGATGKNGGVCNFTASNQLLEGNIVWDAISELSLYLKDSSTLTGAFVKDEQNTRGKGFADLYIGQDCTWTVAGDSELSNVYNAGTIADTSGNPVTIKKADGTVVAEGTSAYTIIVASYAEKANMSGAQKAPDWSVVSVVRPAALGASLAEITTEAPVESSTSPALPDEDYESRKQIAVYVLIGVGVLCVIGLGMWFYQTNKYKLKKRRNSQE